MSGEGDLREGAAPLAEVVRRRARETPDEVAYLAPGDAVSWIEYAERAEELAGHLVSLDFAPGEKIGIVLPDGPVVHVAFLAAEMAGLVIVGIGARAGARELEHILSLTGAVGLMSGSVHQGEPAADWIRRLRGAGLALRHHLVLPDDAGALTGRVVVDGVERPPPARAHGSAEDAARRTIGLDDLFLLNSTSGTTGMPKCVMHDQRRWYAFHRFAVESGGLSSSDVFMSVVPAPFGFGIWTAHVTPSLLGAPTVLMPRFDAHQALGLIETHRVSVLAAVSTQFIMMLDSPEIERRDFGSLRVLYTGGEAVPRDRAEAFEEKTGARVLQFYGSNEVGAVSRTSLNDSREKRLTTAGRAIPEMNLRLLDDEGRDVTGSGRGQPACKGPTLSRGYYADPEANGSLYTDDGWMLLGDIVTIDSDGYLSVVGRTDDFIIRGGKNISARAVEEAVSTHPAVALAAAVAMPDATFGEKVCVYLELREGRGLGLDELVKHLEGQGTSKEVFPERIVVLEELPRASGGKIAKRVLREDIVERMEAE